MDIVTGQKGKNSCKLVASWLQVTGKLKKRHNSAVWSSLEQFGVTA